MSNVNADIVKPEDYERVTYAHVLVNDRFVNAQGQWFQVTALQKSDRQLDILALNDRGPGIGSAAAMRKGETRHIVNTSQWLSRVLRYCGEG